MADKDKKETKETKNTKKDSDSDSESQDAGNPTENVEPGTNTAPTGQTAASPGVLGGDGDDEFEKPITRVDNLGTATDTRVRSDDDEDSEDTPKLFSSLTKALGLKSGDLLGFNERTRVAVYSNGGKYQVSKNRKSIRHLSGPKPSSDIKLNVVDARTRSPFTGTAAAINASVHDDAGEDALQARRSQLQAELASLDAQLGG